MHYKYTLPQLPYAYDALEPYIDAKTMEIHYTKHHQAYIDNLNKALENYPDLQKVDLIELLKNLNTIPEPIRKAVQNNGGGNFNHTLFWTLMSPQGGGDPKGTLKEEIKKTFENMDSFKEQFSKVAKSVFGSGWAWLVTDDNNKLSIKPSHNQDNPISQGYSPILGLDVWEHAYYLKYQNKRVDYIQAWWHVVNWDQVEENYQAALKQK